MLFYCHFSGSFFLRFFTLVELKGVSVLTSTASMDTLGVYKSRRGHDGLAVRGITTETLETHGGKVMGGKEALLPR